MSLIAKEMFDRSIEAWGINSQLAMLAEEASELSVASLHMMRQSRDFNEILGHLAEEIADVEFMIAEIVYYFTNKKSCQLVSLIAEHRKEKEARLIEKLKWRS